MNNHAHPDIRSGQEDGLRWLCWVLATLVTWAALVTWGGSGGLRADETESALSPALEQIYFEDVPETLGELRQMDEHQQWLVKKVSRVTVGLQIGSTQGSGVLVSEDGYVLTAAHVAGQAAREVLVLMPDGQSHRGTSLGMDRDVDAALIKIDPQTRDGQPVQWPYAPMGRGVDLQPGSWCMALGHPGGFRGDRQPVARFGRILEMEDSVLTTDCKLVGGDSGGPLFDMRGRVIGVHSRIGSKVTKNLHVPVDAYRDSWTRLAEGKSWGDFSTLVGGDAILGVRAERDTNRALIGSVMPASPAQRAGMQPGDLVTRFDDRQVETFDDLKRLVGLHQPGDEVTLEVQRGERTLELKVVLAAMRRS